MDSSPTSSLQQFCLRWHNHQASLLSSLPLLLDQSHLTDVTISAEGRTVRAHRVVLSACSSFFSELFRTLDPPYHPVIVLPGTSFGALVALLTFMYSGEVNVYEEQIATLLALAETLGIKGLADFNGNVSKSSPKSETPNSTKDSSDVPSSPASTPGRKMPSPFENIFSKSFQFCPSLMQQPINYSQSSSRRNNNENDANSAYRYQNHKTSSSASSQHQDKYSNSNSNENDDICLTKKTAAALHIANENNQKKTKLSDMRKIDKIAENLRCATATKHFFDQHHKMPLILPPMAATSLMLKPSQIPSLPHHFLGEDAVGMPKTPENLFLDANQNQTMAAMQSAASNGPMHCHDIGMSGDKSLNAVVGIGGKAANSKLYAKCFICHKQLSNQYNLRVHLETHQNVRYACTVCTHVSRSKDALRKHVSYRHPGAPSPCESETRRKRSKLANQLVKQEIVDAILKPLENAELANASLQQMISAPPSTAMSQVFSQMSSASSLPTPLTPPTPSDSNIIKTEPPKELTTADPV